jgi:hypothetical protein
MKDSALTFVIGLFAGLIIAYFCLTNFIYSDTCKLIGAKSDWCYQKATHKLFKTMEAD